MIIYFDFMIKEQKKIRFINDCNTKVDVDLLEQAVIWYAGSPVASIKHIYKHGNYAAVSIFKQKIHIHRLIGLFLMKEKSCKDHFHHKNGDKMDNRIENIERINPSVHISRHQKGRTISDFQRERIIETNHLRKGSRSKHHRKDVTSEMVYKMRSEGMSFNQISLMFNLDWSCVKQRYNDFIYDNPELLEEEEK